MNKIAKFLRAKHIIKTQCKVCVSAQLVCGSDTPTIWVSHPERAKSFSLREIENKRCSGFRTKASEEFRMPKEVWKEAGE